MAETVGWLVAGDIKEGQLDAFNALKEEMIEGSIDRADDAQLRVVPRRG